MMNNFSISLADAAALTANYRNQFSENTTFIKGELFDKESIRSILDQNYCNSLRIYYGLKADNTPCLVIVGVDIYGNDLFNGLLLEHGLTCPPTCSSNNPLNF